MKQLILALLSLLWLGNAAAHCPQELELVGIPFDVNSSYFGKHHAKQLQQLITDTQIDNGYLLLEFPIYKGQTDKKLRKYDRWLAYRRIERVKEYLAKSDYKAPIMTRILTASNDNSRTLRIHWCQDAHPVAIAAKESRSEQTDTADANLSD